MKKMYFGIALAAVLGFLFFYPSLALAAARTGLHLWFDTLLPTLLPFMIFSNILIRADLVRPFIRILAPLFHRLLLLSPQGAYALLMGFLCGCPMGAKILSDFIERNEISKEESQYLLGFCNNLSPSFIITFLVTEQLQRPALILPSLLILYGSPLLYGIFANPAYRRSCRLASSSSVCEQNSPKEPLSSVMIDRCIFDGVLTIVKLGSYVMLFAIFAGILQIFPFPAPAKALATAILEITNGIPALIHAFPYPISFLFLMIFTCFGGLSTLAQTDSIIKNAHLSIRKYVRSKIIICFLASVLSVCFLC